MHPYLIKGFEDLEKEDMMQYGVEPSFEPSQYTLEKKATGYLEHSQSLIMASS